MIPVLFVWGDWGLLALRLVMAGILIVHGLPKLKDISGTAQWFESVGFKPAKFWVTLVALVECVGGLFLAVGFLTQAVALLVAIEFIVILVRIKLGKPFSGMEVDLLLLAAALLVLTVGSGAISVDRMWNILLYA